MFEVTLYFILVVSPLVLISQWYKRSLISGFMTLSMSFFGVILFNLLGSISVLNDSSLFSLGYFLSLMLIIVMFYVYSILLMRYRRKLVIQWKDKIRVSDNEPVVPLLLFLWGISFSILFVYVQHNGMPALFEYDLIDANDVYALRAEKSTNLSEGSHWYRFGFNRIPTFVLIYIYVLHRTSGTKMSKTLLVLNLPLVVAFSSFSMHKSSIIYLVLNVLLVRVALRDIKLNLYQGLKYLTLSFISIVGMLRLYLMDRPFGDVLLLAPI